MKIQNLLILLFFLSSLVVETLTASETFPIKPGGSSHVKVSEGSITCGFAFSTNGGSSENWIITLTETGKKMQCTIARPTPPSYLQFLKFNAWIEGAQIGNVLVQDNEGAPVSSSSWEVAGSQVRPTSRWTGELASITIEVQPVHEEL
jgi:hypothetical protein